MAPTHQSLKVTVLKTYQILPAITPRYGPNPRGSLVPPPYFSLRTTDHFPTGLKGKLRVESSPLIHLQSCEEDVKERQLAVTAASHPGSVSCRRKQLGQRPALGQRRCLTSLQWHLLASTIYIYFLKILIFCKVTPGIISYITRYCRKRGIAAKRSLVAGVPHKSAISPHAKRRVGGRNSTWVLIMSKYLITTEICANDMSNSLKELAV